MAKKTRKPKYEGRACPWCSRHLGLSRLQNGINNCPKCKKQFHAEVFDPPTLKAEQAQQLGAAGLEEGVACANHERNKAVASCERCGIFICELCKIESGEETHCPECFERLSQEGELADCVTRLRDYYKLASTLAIVSILFWPVSIITGPIATVYAVRAVKQRHLYDGALLRPAIVLVFSIIMSIVGIGLAFAVFGGMLR